VGGVKKPLPTTILKIIQKVKMRKFYKIRFLDLENNTAVLKPSKSWQTRLFDTSQFLEIFELVDFNYF
jgi:hypothetical protein